MPDEEPCTHGEADQITWTVASYKRFKALHARAVATGRDHFQFEGHDFYTDFAKYVIEYLEMQCSQHREAK